MTPKSRLVLLVPVIAVAFLVGACGEDSVSASEIEDKAKTSLGKEVGQMPASVDCPSDLDAKEGEKETCTLTDKEGNTYDMTAEITSVDGDSVDFHFQVANKAN